MFLAQLIKAGGDIYEKIPDGRSALDLCDDPDLRSYMIDFQEQNIRNQEKAAAAAAAAQLQQKLNNRLQINSNSLPNGSTSRTGTLYESRSSVSSPYGSGSSLNRTSSIRRASIRDREKAKKLNENFLDVLQAKDKIQEDADEGIISPVTTTKSIHKDEQASSITTTTITTDSTVREPTTIPPVKKSMAPTVEIILPPLKVPPPPPNQTTADTLSDVKRRREERRRGINGSSSSGPPTLTSSSLPLPINDKNNNTKVSNGIHGPITDDSMQRYASPKHINIHHTTDDDHEKRICCTIL